MWRGALGNEKRNLHHYKCPKKWGEFSTLAI